MRPVYVPVRRRATSSAVLSGVKIRNGYVTTPLATIIQSRRSYAFTADKNPNKTVTENGNEAPQGESSLPPKPKFTHPDPGPDSKSAKWVQEYDKYSVATYKKPLPVFYKGEGSYLYDLEDSKYIDFTAGIAVNALGHSDPEIADVIGKQAKILVHSSNLYHNSYTGPLAKSLVEKTQQLAGMKATKVFFSNSGTEANEAALKFARKYAKETQPDNKNKYEIVSFYNSFHGRSFGSLTATANPKYQAAFAPLVPGFKYGKYNGIEQLENLITPNTAGVIVEPIQGEGGVNVGSVEFITELRRRTRAVGAVLIFDEIQSGLGRTGSFWAHAAIDSDASPDIITSAKALGNGFPIGATIVTEEVAKTIKVGDHGTTFGGNPLACTVASHVVERLADQKLLDGVVKKSDHIRARLWDFEKNFGNLVTEVRGIGLILGVQLSIDPTDIINECRQRGLLIISAGKNTIRLIPPLNIDYELIDEGLNIFEEALASQSAKIKSQAAAAAAAAVEQEAKEAAASSSSSTTTTTPKEEKSDTKAESKTESKEGKDKSATSQAQGESHKPASAEN